MDPTSIQPWQIIGSEPLNNYRIFTTRKDRVISPRTSAEHDVYVVEGASWVNVLAYTLNQEILVVNQYRHGVQKVMWEIPGGVMDPGETPIDSAVRELLEETGYQGEKARVIGLVHPNPAFQNNQCFTVLIENAVRVSEPQPDGMEDIEIRAVTEPQFEQMVIQGEITHGLVVVADLWRRLWKAGLLPEKGLHLK